MATEFAWLRTENSDGAGFLEKWQWAYGLRKGRGVHSLAELLLVFEKGFCCLGLGSFICFSATSIPSL
jgi:hypothetical protein